MTERRALKTWIVLFTLIVAWGMWQNRQRVADIQRSRVASCVQTYEGVRQVFMPFFPRAGSRSHSQQKSLDKFNDVIRRLKSKCVAQTKPK